ncbi:MULTISPECIES: murein biosynthesis integral membrane protein MurJ [unclassified Arthrobacter]|uniref:murein biosynthesis integral membrane protein MurJ n=1 Tax=unclassified Arthrobacter TaxID=235627 RepID=UPI0021085CFA|nr:MULTISPECIES: murein biosynthesis integral membrane protein MurJ [unclassified Arthrobacter]MCQ1946300.1 murein biosynthesis integral membrane protein MurJ [Arthrobacter sp. zg-Y1116]MCQ1986241.1 murein biosynthesis integral membrane protein MurJ [Arthrobacter sp. zg-Y844]MCQ1994020.1 murein biosynthesis integral membrane protein MurJ [Arthrobacter sp. zg-Y1171]UWX81869.1 murein biosynthesis integral membrane protein MurJ [Arthrobacter sp. zg-Y1171]
MASGTLVSRVLGLVRTALLAIAIGSTGLVTDIFSSANVLPNFIYLMVAGGVFNAVLVPQIIKASKRPDRGAEYVSRILTLCLLVLAGIALVATLAAPVILSTVLSLGPDQLTLATTFAYWLFPQIFFYGAYAVIGQILNANGRFGAYMWAPVVNNIIAIAGLLVFITFIGREETSSFSPENWTSQATLILAGSTTLGIVMQAVVLLVPLRRLGLGLRPSFGLRGVGLRETGKVAKWTIITMLVGNGAYLVYTAVATIASEARPEYQAMGREIAGQMNLETASMLYIIPHSVITLSLATVLFNQMSHAYAEKNYDGVRETLSQGLRAIGVATVFCSAVLIVLAGPISIWFSGGSNVSAALQAQVLVLLAITAPFLSATFLMNRAFYANEDAKTPLVMQLILSAFGIALALGAAALPADQIIFALAIAYSLGNVAAVVLSHIFLRRSLGDYGGARVFDVHVRLVVAALAAGAVGSAALALLGGYSADGFAWQSVPSATVVLVVCGSLMAVAYYFMLRVLKVSELDAFLAPLLAKLRRTP